MKKHTIFPLLFALIFALSWVTFASAAEYSRSLFPCWSDLDGNGLDTREEILSSRSWVSPYDGKLVGLHPDLDHLVPLHWAWNHGADQWTMAKREQFANDPDNLIITSASLNRSKGDRGPTVWLPPNLSYIPDYIELFVTICKKYGLEYDGQLFARIQRKTETCGRNSLKCLQIP